MSLRNPWGNAHSVRGGRERNPHGCFSEPGTVVSTIASIMVHEPMVCGRIV